MKANELRIGNYVSVNDEPVIIEDISLMGINDQYGIGNPKYDLDDIKPIPLTHELLIKCGFEAMDDKQILHIHPDTNYEIMDASYAVQVSLSNKHKYSDSKFVAVSVAGSRIISSIGIDYLHQLQNLYFALSGKELDIKL